MKKFCEKKKTARGGLGSTGNVTTEYAEFAEGIAWATVYYKIRNSLCTLR